MFVVSADDTEALATEQVPTRSVGPARLSAALLLTCLTLELAVCRQSMGTCCCLMQQKGTTTCGARCGQLP
jgi:hypothetical protein